MTHDEPNQTRDLLSFALGDEPPLGLNPEMLAAAGHRRVRRRRTGLAAAGLALTAVAVAGVGYVATGDRTPATPPAAGPSDGVCGPDPGARPEATPKGDLPDSAKVDAAVSSALGGNATDQVGRIASQRSPRDGKYSYLVKGSEKVEVEISAAADLKVEMEWELASRQHECRTPVQRMLKHGISAVVTPVVGGVEVLAVQQLRVYVNITTPDGVDPAVTEQQATDLAVALVMLG